VCGEPGRARRNGETKDKGGIRVELQISSGFTGRAAGWTKALSALLLVLICGVASGQTITGVVTNRTNDKAASGDDVVLLKLAQGMQELARAKTDSKGRYTIKVPADEAGALHLVRVSHDGANYFTAVPAGTTKADVDVYTAAAEVDGIVVS
jgi:5-hydroxyisourate hydrolase-like protein (transthyretin family)